MANAPIRVLIADDHPIVRSGVRQLIASAFPNAQFGEAANGQEVLDAVRAARWDVLTLDISMPVRSGLEILPELRALAPGLRILVLTIHAEEQFAIRLLKRGVAGYVTKDQIAEQVVDAVRRIMAGSKYVSTLLAERLARSLDQSTDKLPHDTLSDREFQVMRMLASGLTVAEIAVALALHVRTISTFRRHILRKLNVKSTQEIAYYAIRAGLVEWPSSG